MAGEASNLWSIFGMPANDYPWLSCLWIILDYLPDVKSASARLLSGDLPNILSLRMADDAARLGTKLPQNLPIFPNLSVAVQKKEANIQMSWVELFRERQLFKDFGQRSTNNREWDIWPRRRKSNTLTFSSDSQLVKGGKIMRLLTPWGRGGPQLKSLRQSTQSSSYKLRGFYSNTLSERQRGWLAAEVVKRRASQGKSRSRHKRKDWLHPTGFIRGQASHQTKTGSQTIS